MQGHDAYPDPSAGSPGAHENGAVVVTPVETTEPYVHPTIPLGLPHIVQFVEASLCHLPMSVRFVGDRLSRYANAKGVVSMAIPFICQITGLGSKNTAEHHIRLMESMGVLEKKPGKGGQDRKSNTYIFLGEQRNWRPLPTERPGTDPWVALAQARREIEELRAEVARLKNGGAIGHSGVTDGEKPKAPDPTSHSYENPDFSTFTEAHGAIGHSKVTDGSMETPTEENPHSHEAPNSEPSSTTQNTNSHSTVTNGSDEGQQYLARRARVEALVMEHRGYYERSFRGGVLSAVHHFSLNDENEQELLRQISVIRAGQEPGSSGARAAQGLERPPPREERLTESGRREVEYCPDCSSPYTTFNGEERCPDCTSLRRSESEA